ncbi:MAG: GYF domain-containing protein [Verrucomicrobiota bacterium]
MQIHVARNSAQLGIFAPEEIVAGLQSGRFLASDLAWRDGMAAWTPLGDWSEFRGVGVPPPPPSSASPFGAKDEASLAMPSWEREPSFSSYVATIKEVALDPVRTFANLRDGGYARPIAFSYWSLLPAWILGSLLYGGLIFFMMSVGQGASLPKDPAMQWLSGTTPMAAAVIISGFLGVIFVLTPLLQFLGAAFTHLLLLPWRPSGSYAQTYRANAYASAAFMPFVFIPCLNYIAAPWQMVALIIAHSQVHRIAWWKVVISLVVIPCCCVCGFYAMLFATIANKFAH